MWRKAGRYTTEQKNIDGASQLIAYYLPAFPCPWFLPSPVPNVSEVSNRNQIFLYQLFIDFLYRDIYMTFISIDFGWYCELRTLDLTEQIG